MDTHIHACKDTFIYIYIYIHVYVCIHDIYIYIYIYTYITMTCGLYVYELLGSCCNLQRNQNYFQCATKALT